MIEIIKYTKDYEPSWNKFVSESKNGTFLFNRNYMDYHSDRFTDSSLMVFEHSQLVALLPANLKDSTCVYSHAGLSYGGLIVRLDEYTLNIARYFAELLKYLSNIGYSKLIIKLIPDIFTRQNSQEFEYFFSILGANLLNVDLSSSLLMENLNQLYQSRKKRNIKKAIKHGLVVRSKYGITDFWEKLLIPNLQQKYRLRPVHTIREIESLIQENPQNIKFYGAYQHEELLAGTVIFETETVAHAQYISASKAGQEVGANDFLFDYLITSEFKHKKHFSFGVSNERDRIYLNKGLLEWKEGFGARTVVYKTFNINTANYHILEKLVVE